MYNQQELEKDLEANCGRPYQQCSISVMDTIADPNITFDEKGICNYYYEYLEAEKQFVKKGEEGEKCLEEKIKEIKSAQGKKKYDSILGLSGGVDSTYLCLLAKENGLNPLVVHCDNGWNSELAQSNIEQTVKNCGFDLYTYVINWEHFRELQLSYLKASVVDIEVLTDHAFMAVLYEQARKWKIKYVLAGMNVVTENVLPKHWIFSKQDATNIKAIHKQFGRQPIKDLCSFPFLNYETKRYCDNILKMEVLAPLNWIDYKYDEVKIEIKNQLDWQDYGGKHYESIWTRFYQGYLLPNKFNIDKRKAHYSNLIYSGQLTKDEATIKLREKIIPDRLKKQDLDFVLKKFELNEIQFHEIMSSSRREHNEFEIQQGFWTRYPYLRFLKPVHRMLSR